MSRSRYQQVPQADEIIDLNTITNDPSYNYNSGVPNSPPPSFHSSQSIDQYDDLQAPPSQPPPIDTSRLSPVSFNAPTIRSVATGNESIVLNLQRRIDRLEEAIGRLLIEKAPVGSSDSSHNTGSNCCVHFADDLPLAEAHELHRGSNCCVTFGGKPRSPNEVFVRKILALLIVLGAIGFLATIVAGSINLANRGGRCVDCPNGGSHGGVS